MAYETQQFVSSLVLNQVRPPNTWWSADYQTITCDGQIIHMSKLRSGIQAIIHRCWDIYDEITGGRRFANQLPTQFRDDLNSRTRGYSFLLFGPFADPRNSFLEYFCSDDCPWRAGDLRDGVMSWDIASLRNFFSLTAEFNKHLAVLSYVCPAVSTRISEHLASKYTNDSRQRNLFMMLDEMVEIQCYSKMTNQTGLDICTPAFYPKALKDLMLEYLAGGLRDCETLFGEYAYGGDAKTLYSR